jgi:hypothetical protein
VAPSPTAAPPASASEALGGMMNKAGDKAIDKALK